MLFVCLFVCNRNCVNLFFRLISLLFDYKIYRNPEFFLSLVCVSVCYIFSGSSSSPIIMMFVFDHLVHGNHVHRICSQRRSQSIRFLWTIWFERTKITPVFFSLFSIWYKSMNFGATNTLMIQRETIRFLCKQNHQTKKKPGQKVTRCT